MIDNGTKQPWWKMPIGAFVTILVLVISMIGSAAVAQYRIDTLQMQQECTQNQVDAQAESINEINISLARIQNDVAWIRDRLEDEREN